MKKIILPALLATVFTSCDKSPYKGYDLAEETGLYYRFFKHDEKAKTPQLGELTKVILTYQVYGKDSVLYDSRKMSKEESGTVLIPVGKSPFKGSIEDGLKMMAIGDSASFIINADSLFIKAFNQPKLPPQIPSGSMLTFNVKLVKVQTREQMEKEFADESQKKEALEQSQLEGYLKANNITEQPLASGLYFIELKKGTGKQVNKGDMVSVHYTGTLLDGKVFDSSVQRGQPIEFPVGVGQVIPGWDEGIPMLKVGGKAKLIIPSKIGYGPRESGPIPAFSTLVFEVEVMDTKPAPATGAGPAPMGK